jgi:hypothetical protein
MSAACTQHYDSIERNAESETWRTMNEMRDTTGTELLWNQPNRKTRAYELRSGDVAVLMVRWEKKRGARAVAESAGGQWTIDKIRALRSRIVIRQAGSATDLATFTGSWDGGGTLEFRDGRTYRWDNTNWRHTAWAWTSRSGQPLLRFKGKSMTIEPAGATLPEISLLAALSWYLNIMNSQSSDDAGAVAAIVATMGGV